MPKKVLIALPERMLAEVDYIAHSEHRTRSDLIRESLRRYCQNYAVNPKTTVRPCETQTDPATVMTPTQWY